MRALREWIRDGLLLWAMLASSAFAHALPGTAVLLDFDHRDVAMQIDAPLDQFELGFKHPVMDAPMETIRRYPHALPAYLLAHVQAVAPDGRPWHVEVESLEIAASKDASPIDLHASLRLIPPPGAPVRQLRLNYSVINHEVMTHTVLVFAHSDWQNGVFSQNPQLLGTIRWLTSGIDIDRRTGSFWHGFGGVFRMGVQHIAEGTDHLLFLLTLLLPSPLRRDCGRWGSYAGVRHTIAGLAALVTAFTLGHSASLIVGTMTNLDYPSQPVEIAIALSILVSALHAWRPLLRGKETWVAVGFGLIHGLSFSEVLRNNGLDGWHRAAAALGFNLGIEFMQLTVVAAVVPWLILLAKAGRYTAVRTAGAAFSAVASLAWMVERITGFPNFVSRMLDEIMPAAPYLVVVLALCSLMAFAIRRAPTPSRDPEFL
ncbi:MULTISPECIES: HupE/UreJ family protein [unclassified Paraburkholderia]|uniref:HupE/UreJ family protein n=1 Tax=unclassified Paraburkholderia TaxID=2615204 RepID=UPI002AB1CAE2|nr:MULTISPECIES: HupE/UreJ family protein [unclassified Paraburkholderia]